MKENMGPVKTSKHHPRILLRQWGKVLPTPMKLYGNLASNCPMEQTWQSLAERAESDVDTSTARGYGLRNDSPTLGPIVRTLFG